MRVRWEVSGGVAPNRISVEGYEGDHRGAFKRPTGWADIPCSLTPGQPSFYYLTTPDARSLGDSSPRTRSWDQDLNPLFYSDRRAGHQADADLDVYILHDFEQESVLLLAGEQYRSTSRSAVFRLRIPQGLDLEFCCLEAESGDGDDYS